MYLYRASMSALSARTVKATDAAPRVAAARAGRTLTRASAAEKAVDGATGATAALDGGRRRPDSAFVRTTVAGQLIKGSHSNSSGEPAAVPPSTTTTTTRAPTACPPLAAPGPWPSTRPGLRRATEQLAARTPGLTSLVGLETEAKPAAAAWWRLSTLVAKARTRRGAWAAARAAADRGAHAGGSRALADGPLKLAPYRALADGMKRAVSLRKLAVFAPALPRSIQEAGPAACGGLAGVPSNLLAASRGARYRGIIGVWVDARAAAMSGATVAAWRAQCAADAVAAAERAAAAATAAAVEDRLKAALACARHPAVLAVLAYSVRAVDLERRRGESAAAAGGACRPWTASDFPELDGLAALFVEVAPVAPPARTWAQVVAGGV